MISRKNFRINLYKMMLFKNIVENKVHKEKMTMLYAFEQLIINTEDGEADSYYDEEVDPYDHPFTPEEMAQFKMHHNLPAFARIPMETEYVPHIEDIIDEEEEELEESCEEHQFKSLVKLSERKKKKEEEEKKKQGEIVGLQKITPDELIEYARNKAPTQMSQEEIKSQYEVAMDYDMFEKNKNFSDPESSLTTSNVLS